MTCIIRSKTQLFVSSMLLPHKSKQTMLKTKNQHYCFQNSTQLNFCCQTRTRCSQSKPVHTALSDSISNMRIFQVSAAFYRAYCVGHSTQYTECHAQKNMLRISLRNFCFQKPEWCGICRSHISRDVLDFSEVVDYWSSCEELYRNQFGFALLYHVRLAQYCCIWLDQIFRFRFCVCNSSRFRSFCQL